LASQISISAQQVPYFPVPAFLSAEEGVQPSTLACAGDRFQYCVKAKGEETHLSGNEFDITRALRVAVTSSILGASLVSGVLGHTTVRVHLDEVESSVEATRKLGDVDFEGELLPEDVEHLILGVVLHKVDSRADVGAGHELEGEGTTAGGDTVGTRVVGALESAVGRTGDVVGTERAIPSLSSVAVGEATGIVDPTPVGVEGDGRGFAGAAACGTLLPGKGGVVLSSAGADLLPERGRREEGKEDKRGGDHG